ncbi:uncharacterized protein LACBIDRAFT_310711 [Laccaria bicolor S238N-H82]|uniref:Predicted protein n=1 Tax=Laccaria bicolor (strain S238N-H82 / ATCC MYA-4686) TaxID=486041 RepID=B0DUY2_LACBS|nr:uncharacterized protein LACBIDRAFT_310711 [Laccaria bicolor S238N-H82]EDR01688.1 predicted protein [Laccaria bicolor S238N-H82]|eukprot:XP_001887764.1 predicted protein [Laccaria bicolor S238N-H82]
MNLVVHPVIQRAVELAQSQVQRPNIPHIPSKLLTDSTFLESPLARQRIDLSHPRGQQLLAELREGIGGDRGADEEQGGGGD